MTMEPLVMELTENVPAEQIPFEEEKKVLKDLLDAEVKRQSDASPLPLDPTDQKVFDKMERVLLIKIAKGEPKMQFNLGLLYFEQCYYDKAFACFESSKDHDFQSMYQYCVMLYDGIGVEQDPVKAVELMKKLADSDSRHASHLQPAARFNIGRAYFQGFASSRRLDEEEAVRWWLMAADDGNPKASIKAQSILGMYYSRQFYSLDLGKAFFWHTEACGNGSLESQGALGVMYLYGVGVKKDIAAAYLCLKNASDRGNVFASANLVSLFYSSKLFSRAADLASKVCGLKYISAIAYQTDCLPNYIEKGISMASFFLARCLHRGLGVTHPDPSKARRLYSKSFRMDPTVCAKLHSLTVDGVI